MAQGEASWSPAAGRRVPATVLVLGAIASIQVGAALAKRLFDQAGPAGTTFMRAAGAALVLLVLWRPRVRGLTRRQWALIAAFGLAQAAVTLAFYAAIARIPIAVAVAIEFTGPLGVAVAGSRHAVDGLWVALAGAGVLLLTGWTSGAVDPLGVGLAFLAAAWWACYILLSQRLGAAVPGWSGLALSVAVGALVLAPLGLADAGAALLDWRVLLGGLGVGVLAAVLPYSLELAALRRLPTRVFGVLMSLEPGAAAVAAFAILGERLLARELAGIACVVAASAGATLFGRRRAA
jgi:inner membrane transporter RhtA